jgi:hypothetical protein
MEGERKNMSPILYTEPIFLNVYGAKELIPPAYVAWWAGTITLFLLGS